MTFGLKERYDVMDWVNWYQENMDPDIPIFLGGVSMGATSILMAAADAFPEEVKGMFADCGFTSPYEILLKVGKERFYMLEHPTMDGLNLYCKRNDACTSPKELFLVEGAGHGMSFVIEKEEYLDRIQAFIETYC